MSQKQTPPQWALRLLKWLCPKPLQEAIIGDLLEQYEINVNRSGRLRSNWLFTYNTLRFLRYGILKRQTIRHQSNGIAMFRNYFLTSFRSLAKNKFYLFLNVLGLSIGIAACVMCYLHINYEMSYDRYNSKADNIYRLGTGDLRGGQGWVKVSAPIPPALKRNIPEIVQFTRFSNVTRNPQVTVQYENAIFSEAKFYMADPDILNIFDINLLRGQKEQALADMNNVIISESMAEKYFEEISPIGRTIRLDDRVNLVITGVFEDVPFNSHFDFDFLINFENLERMLPGTSLTGNWSQYNYYSYLELVDGSNPDLVEVKIKETEVNLGDNRNVDLSSIGIQPLTDIHFNDNRGNIKQAYDMKYVYVYGAIALATLFISFINFVNLSIAGSTKRVKEVGVRKVVGAARGQLILQFITESFLISLVASITSLLISKYAFVPVINRLMDSRISMNLFDPTMWLILIGLLLLIALSSGSYIAYFIISSQPINALKGSYKAGNRGVIFKNVLLGLQFCISSVLILSSLFIYQQLQFISNKDLGMSKDQLVNVALSNKTAQENGEQIASRFRDISGVRDVARSNYVPGNPNANQNVWWEGQEEDISMFLIRVDKEFIQTVDMQLVEGSMDAIRNTQGMQVVLNEAAKKVTGWDLALGKPFSAFGEKNAVTVSGVVKDYNFRSLHHNIAPCVLIITDNFNYNQLTVKLEASNIALQLTKLESAFLSVLPEMQFEVSFMDEGFAKLYEAETRTGKIVRSLTFIAILLAVLGLYALLTFAVQERTRELAIRKVLGVSLKQVLLLLSSNYIRLLVVANIFAIPITWYMLNGWLENFNYRISLNIITFIGTVILTFILIYIIAGLKTLQSSRINPSNALRHE